MSPIKKKMPMGDDTPYLPEEIITDILKRLPVKSLIKFHCVSKQWKIFIKSPSFISNHLHHSTQNRPSLLLCGQSGMREPLHLRLIDCEMHAHEIPNPPLIGSMLGVMIIGSSNGLLCVATNKYKIPGIVLPCSLLLWNPATREIREISKTITSEIPKCDIGFGFSAIVDDYKIVKTYNNGYEIITAVEVYSLNTGSWKEIELGPLKGVGLSTDGCVAVNGCIFWLGFLQDQEDKDDSLIVSFDIAIEVFTLISLPPLPYTTSFDLAPYKNKVSILDLSNCIDLWVLEEDVSSSTKSWSWTKKFSSNPCPSTLEFPGIIFICTSGGEYEIEEENFGQCLISILTNEGKMIPIAGCRSGNVYNHVESLVPIGNI